MTDQESTLPSSLKEQKKKTKKPVLGSEEMKQFYNSIWEQLEEQFNVVFQLWIEMG